MKQAFCATMLMMILLPLFVRAQPVCATTTNNTSDSFQNESLRVHLWPQGTVVFTHGPGYIMRDGALGMKFGWWRLVPGQLTITGRRLDAEAPPALARVPAGYGDAGFQATLVVFPTPGCWEITGRIGDATLTFITRVEKIGDGPSGRGNW